MLGDERQRLREDRVVDALAGQTVRQYALQLARLEEEATACLLLAVIARIGAWQRQTRVDALLGRAANHVIEKAADLAHVARGLGKTFLMRVELLEHHHRQVYVVLFKAVNRGRIVHQDVSVEHEQTAHCGYRRFGREIAAGGGRTRLRETAPLQELLPRASEPLLCATHA